MLETILKIFYFLSKVLANKLSTGPFADKAIEARRKKKKKKLSKVPEIINIKLGA